MFFLFEKDEPATNGLDVCGSKSMLYFPARTQHVRRAHVLGYCRCFRPCRDSNANRGRRRSDVPGEEVRGNCERNISTGFTRKKPCR